MADDINLPNLVSHLQVNLQNTSGVIADASRQGSAVGAALGESLQRRVQAATNNIPPVVITDDSNGFDRDLDRIRRELQELGEKRIGVDISVEDALKQMDRLQPHIDRLARTHPDIEVRAFVADAAANLADLQAAARRLPEQVDIDVDVDAAPAIIETKLLERALGRLGTAGRSTTAALVPLVGTLTKAGAATGSLLPLVGGLVTTLANVAPAAGLAVTGSLALGSATAALKIGLSGVSDAAALAFDPAKAAEFDKALAKLSPNARSFVKALQGLQPQLDGIKKTVQDKLFEGLDKQLTATAKTTLPALKKSLTDSADALNLMGKGVLTAARDLGKSGALGTALDGANAGLKNLSRAPGQLVLALGQVGAAAAPAFDRLTKAGGSALDRLSEKLTKSFESGGMERAIEGAIDLLGQLGRVAGNITDIIRNTFGAASAEGKGLFDTLETITGAIADATSTREFTGAIGALSKTMGVLAATVGPLLGKAIAALGPVITTLAPPVQDLIKLLGEQFGDIIDELAPVLESLAGAVAELVPVFEPFIELAGQLIADTLPLLTPLFDTLAQIFIEMAPVAKELADNLSDQLKPVLEELPGILEELMPSFTKMAEEIFPLLAETLKEIGPQLGELAVSLSETLVAATPLILKLMEFGAAILKEVLPAVQVAVGILSGIFRGALMIITDVLDHFVTPALKAVAQLLRGDFVGAILTGKGIVDDFQGAAKRAFQAVALNAAQFLFQAAGSAKTAAQRLAVNFVSGMLNMLSQANSLIRRLPGIIIGAMPAPTQILYGIGQNIIGGLTSGIRAAIPSLVSLLSSITSKIPDWKGPKKKDASLLTPAGKSIIKGLVDGLDASTASLKTKLGSITNLIERAISINSGNSKKTSGLNSLLSRVESDNKRLLSLAKARDAIGVKLTAAQKKLDDLVKAKAKEAADITSGILGEANIVQGNPLVNSVTAITVGLQQALQKTKDFQADIAALKKSGLRSDILQQIADAGVDGGAATADALAKATPAELKRINDLQAQLAKAAASTGNTVASALYDSGIKAAQGLVDGLKKQEGAIQKQMDKIGASMVAAIKKALKIKSPSRVLADVGEMTMAGLPVGFERMRAAVARSAASVAGAAVSAASGVGSIMPSIPGAGQLAGVGAGGALVARDTTNNFYLTGGDATPDGILRALSWQGLVGRKAG